MAVKRRIFTSGLVIPQAIKNAYAREITAIVAKMIKSYKDLILLYHDKREQVALDAADNSWLTVDVQKRLDKLGKQWRKAFETYAQEHSKEMVYKVLKATDLQLKSALRDYMADKHWELIRDKIPVPMQQTIQAHISENVSLITSIATQYHERIAGTIYRAITGGGTLKQVQMEFKKSGNMATRRAKLIATDQINKTYNTLAARRMAQVGIQRVEWVHGNSKEPRHYHITKWDGVSGTKDHKPNGLNGFIFDLDNLPVIDEKTGERGLPGQLPFCSCRIEPVID